MMGLLIFGLVIAGLYQLSQGTKANAIAGIQPNTLLQNTGGRNAPVVTGEPLSAALPQLTQAAQGRPQLFLGPPIPAPSFNLNADSFVLPNGQRYSFAPGTPLSVKLSYPDVLLWARQTNQLPAAGNSLPASLQGIFS